MNFTVYIGDVKKSLKLIEKESVDATITSPPYWGLRDYGVDGQIGLEATPQAYIKNMVEVSEGIKRVLKPGGSYWLNLGDTYFAKRSKDETVDEYYGNGRNGGHPRSMKSNGSPFLKAKQKLLIPHRTAIALQDNGWICRNDIVWHKPSHMPSSVKDRCTNSFEFMFHFVKQKKYYYDLDTIREPHTTGNGSQGSRLTEGRLKSIENPSHGKIDTTKDQTIYNNPNGKNPSDMWKLTEREQNLKEFFNNKGSGGNPGHGIQGSTLGTTNPNGKNPSDYWNAPYSVQPRSKEFVEIRNLPDLQKLAEWLKQWKKTEQTTIELIEKTLNSQAPHHWFSAESYPTKEEWIKFKKQYKIVQTPFDEALTLVSLKPAIKTNNPIGKNPSDFWSINPKPFPEAHFACFPPALVRKPIKATVPKKTGIVLDPFLGSGTTLQEAMQQGKNGIGIELNQEYAPIIMRRLNCRAKIEKNTYTNGQGDILKFITLDKTEIKYEKKKPKTPPEGQATLK